MSVQGKKQRTKHGPRHWAINGKRRVDEDGRAAGWRGVIAAATEQVMAQERLQHLAHTDSLTGLANRFTLHAALRAALVQRRPVALLALDLDHFKLVNDTLGHAAGDKLLQTVAARLLACQRPADLVARLGGDEFALLVLVLDEVDGSLDVGARREMALHWQPKVEIESSRIVGAEVPLRWHRPPLGNVAPIEFIPQQPLARVERIRQLGSV